MSYKAGDAKIARDCGHPECQESRECERTMDDRGVPDSRSDDEGEWLKRDVIYLPHSCDEWVIGGPAEARAMVADLNVLIGKLEGR